MGATMIVFLENEVQHWSVHEGTGQLQMSIAMEVVVSKLPENKRVHACPWTSREAVEDAYFPQLQGIAFTHWIAMNFEQTRTGTRTLSTYAHLLETLCRYAQTYGRDQLDRALSKCDVPRKCTLEYVKAILENTPTQVHKGRKEPPREEKPYSQEIDEAVSRLCHSAGPS